MSGRLTQPVRNGLYTLQVIGLGALLAFGPEKGAATVRMATDVPPVNEALAFDGPVVPIDPTTTVAAEDTIVAAPAAVSEGLVFPGAVSTLPARVAAPASPGGRTGQVTTVIDGRLGAGWEYYGWSKSHSFTTSGGQFDFGEWQGVIFGSSASAYKAESLEFSYKTAKKQGTFLYVSLGTEDRESIVELPVANAPQDSSGWYFVSIPLSKLNPEGIPFSRVRIRTTRRIAGSLIVTINKMRLVGSTPVARAGANPAAGSPVAAPNTVVAPDSVSSIPPIVNAPAASGGVTKDGAMSIDCKVDRKPISPLIYGISFSEAGNQKENPWTLGATANRWGGNPTSRYNWKLGNVWNTAFDYYFRNVQINGTPNASENFLQKNAQYGMVSMVSMPMIGWVSKDSSSYSFPVSQFGAQQQTDPDIPDAGNGMTRDGKIIPGGDPRQTSVASSPEFVGEWAAKLRGRVGMYFLDNEPDLWSSTHRDIRPEPVGYDELLDLTIRYGSVIRKNDPKALIAGPTSWGWLGYFYSGLDAKDFGQAKDRKAHGNVPLLKWYMQKIREHEKKTGTKLLDVLDVHFYPQGQNVYSNAVDPQTNALRIRQVRSLWDPTYTDESWINEKMAVLPMLQSWIQESAPGLGLSIGEWNFGGEQHMSGGIATAETLGRFAQFNVFSANYWTAPPDNSPSYFAFRAFRNADGQGLRFLDEYVGSTMSNDVSVFASTDKATSKLVAVVLNKDPSKAAAVNIAVKNCKNVSGVTTYTYDGSQPAFAKGAAAGSTAGSIALNLRPYTITVVKADLK